MTNTTESNQVSNVLAKIHKRYFGKGPLSVSVAVQSHCIITRVSGILTQLEKSLLATGDGARKVENIRDEIFHRFNDAVIRELRESNGPKISGVLYQVFVDSDEAIMVIFFNNFSRNNF